MGLIDSAAFCDLLDKHSKIYGGEEEKISNLLKSLIEKAPTVDAVQVVRCRDCKNCWHCGWSYSEGALYGCQRFDNEVKLDDFCSYGERKDKK